MGHACVVQIHENCENSAGGWSGVKWWWGTMVCALEWEIPFFYSQKRGVFDEE